MNILFYTNLYPESMLGGIERITSRLSVELLQRGHNVYNFYTHKYSKQQTLGYKGTLFVPRAEILEKKELIREYIVSNKIDVIINQMVWPHIELMQYLKECSICKIIFVYHFNPGAEYEIQSYKNVLLPVIKEVFFKQTISQLYKNIREVKRKFVCLRNLRGEINNQYHSMYNLCDNFVLLSPSFIKLLKHKIGIKDLSKVVAIPNMLSYDDSLSIEELSNKEKVVLVVSRMDEVQKKISRVLKLWKKIERDERLMDWSLEVVGEGDSLDSYKQYAAVNLNRVKFFGKQNPKEFYKRASIFLMTSAFEGFGITLIEAQQMGCVPIALNTFAAAEDIISDGETGCLSQNMDECFIQLKDLMLDKFSRNKFAVNAIESSKTFSPKVVVDKWEMIIK